MKGIVNQVIESNEIEQVILTEGRITITFKKLPEAVDLKEAVIRSKRKDSSATAEQKNKTSLKRVKDKRIRAILEAYPRDTFKSWLAREYPDLCDVNVVSFLFQHKDLSVRKACEIMREKNGDA